MTDEGKKMCVSTVIATIATPFVMHGSLVGRDVPTFEFVLIGALCWGVCWMISQLTIDL